MLNSSISPSSADSVGSRRRGSRKSLPGFSCSRASDHRTTASLCGVSILLEASTCTVVRTQGEGVGRGILTGGEFCRDFD